MPSAQVAQLAADLAPYLLPLLPILEKTGELAGGAAAKALGTELGKGVPGALRRLWHRLASRLEARPQTVDALRRAAESSDAEAAVRAEIATFLEGDGSFPREVAKLLDQVIAERIVFSHMEVDVHGGNLCVIDLEDPDVLTRAEVRKTVASGRIGETLPGSTTVGLRIRRLGAPARRRPSDDGG